MVEAAVGRLARGGVADGAGAEAGACGGVKRGRLKAGNSVYLDDRRRRCRRGRR